MKLVSMTMKPLRIAFRSRFKHASRARTETESVYVVARTASGIHGHGEGCPRDYVTGETVTSALAFFATHRDRLLDEITDLESLQRSVRTHAAEIDRDPAAWCAIELALLDALGKEHDGSVEALLGLPELHGEFQYSAVVGDMETDELRQRVDQFVAAGFDDFKIKLRGDLDHDRFALDYALQAGARRLRVDANNLWHEADEALAFLEALSTSTDARGASLFAVEEPLRAGDTQALAELARILDTSIVLDESLLRARQLADLPGPAEPWIANLRVSKFGGLLRSLHGVDVAREHGLRIIVGAQVGETSLLTRAALPVAQKAGELLTAQEGAFGTLLLESDLCDPPLMFGEGGRLRAEDVPRRLPGFGLL